MSVRIGGCRCSPGPGTTSLYVGFYPSHDAYDAVSGNAAQPVAQSGGNWATSPNCPDPALRPAGRRVEDDLDVAVFAPIEPAERLGRIRERPPVRDDNARFDAPGADQVAQRRHIAFVVVAAHADGDVFAEQLRPRDRQVATRFQLARGPRVVGQEDARDAEPSGGTDQSRQGVDDAFRVFATWLREGAPLEADGIDAAVLSVQGLLDPPRLA